MRNLLVFLSISLFLPPFAQAQYKQLKRDNDITYIAEFEMDLSFDIQQKGSNTNTIILKKFIQPDEGSGEQNGNWLTGYLYQHILNGDLLTYKTSKLTKPLTINEVKEMVVSIDTVITFYPETFEEQIRVIKNELDPSSISTCRTKQAIYFDKTTGDISTCLIAITPLIDIKDENGHNIARKPLGWVKMESLAQNLTSNDPAVTWAATINTLATPLDLSSLHVVKGGLDLRKHLKERALDNSHQIESGNDGFNSKNYLSKQQVEEIYSGSIDTVVTFNPSTYEEHIQVINNEFELKDINEVRLVQEWYYLPEKRLLVNRLKAIAPTVKIYDTKKEFLFNKPLYYIRYF